MSKKTQKIIFSLLITSIFFGTAVFALEQIKITSPSQIPQIIRNVANWLYTIVLALAVIFVLVAAFTYLTGGGSPQNVQKAHKQLFYAVLSIAVAIIAFSVEKIVISLMK